jgi:G3E family GTPase
VPSGYSGAADDLPPLAIVDMPGYGFAKAPKAQVDNWTKLVFDYLRGRVTLKRVYLLIDARHGIKKNDEEVMDLLDKAAVSYQVVLTKIDKIKEAGVPRMLAETAERIKNAAGRLSGGAGDLVGKEYRHRGVAGGDARPPRNRDRQASSAGLKTSATPLMQ